MKRIIVISIVGIALITLTVFKLLSNQAEAKSKIYIRDKTKSNSVEIVVPKMYSFSNNQSYQGLFEANRINQIGSEAGGKIIAVQVEEGDYIQNGSNIATIDNEIILLQMEGLQLNIDQLAEDRKRLIELGTTNIVTKAEIEKVELGLKSAQNQFKLLEKQLKNTQIKAPFSGIVTRRLVELGSVIGPGTPIIELIDIKSLKFNFMVSENDIYKFNSKDVYDVECDVLKNQKFKGTVNFVSAKADNAHNFKIQLLVKNTKDLGIKAGMFGKVSLNLDDSSMTKLSIPRKALLGSIQNPEVYKVVQGAVKRVQFIAGLSNSQCIEIVSGLHPEDSIVVKGQMNLSDNSKIIINK